MGDTRALCAVYDERGNQLHRGTDSTKADEIAKRAVGTTRFRMYHRVGGQVCVNDHVYSQGRRVGHEMFYISEAEIEVLLQAMKEPEAVGAR